MKQHRSSSPTEAHFGWRKKRCCLKTSCGFFILASFILLLGHFIMLHYGWDYYSDDCYLSKDKILTMRFIVTTISDIFTQLNQTYWLDDGTLLGVMRDGDILPYDGDVDFSRVMYEDEDEEEAFLKTLGVLLKAKGMKLGWKRTTKQVRVDMNGMYTDIMRWVYHPEDNEQGNSSLASACLHPDKFPLISSPECKEEFSSGVLKRYRPQKLSVNIHLHRAAMLIQGGETFKADLLIPTVTKPLPFTKSKTLTGFPRQTVEFLKLRYGATWRLPVYFKWKCYFQPNPAYRIP